VYVFDVAQTEGKELPELASKVSGNVGEYRERLFDFAIAQGIQIEFKESIAPALGMSYGGTIALLPGQGTAEEFSTLVHELSHEMLHKAERRTATTKTVRETEAEAIAFVIGTAIGLQTGRASADYIHLYHGNAALLAESLEVRPAYRRRHPLRTRNPSGRDRSRDGKRPRTGTGESQLSRSTGMASRIGYSGVNSLNAKLLSPALRSSRLDGL